MTTHLRFHELAIHTDSNVYRHVFAPGINTITGEVGSGKSSLLNLCKHCLGGSVPMTPALRQGVRRASLDATIGQTRLIFSRGTHTTFVDVYEPDGTTVERLSTSERPGSRRTSDFLLGLLDLPNIRVTTAKPSGRSDALSFYDFYAYCYLAQPEIDRSVVNHLDNTRRSKRVGAFEVMLGLVDEHAAELRVELGRVADELPTARRPVATIDRFLAQVGTPTETQLLIAREEAERRHREAEATLSKVRDDVRVVTSRLRDQQEAMGRLNADLAAARGRLNAITSELTARQRQRAQLVQDLERLGRVGVAAKALGPFEYRQCPRCAQRLDGARSEGDRCVVCLQPDPAAATDASPDEQLEAEQRRLEAALADLDALAAVAQDALPKAQAAERALATALHERSIELDLRTREYVSPRYEQIAEASAALAAAAGDLRTIETSLAYWRERDALAKRVKDLEQRRRDLENALRESEAELAGRRERVVQLSQVFDEIIRALDMPWYEPGARIDLKTYLPIVNGVGLESLGSGGMKMMTNVAYHLALLTYGLSEGGATAIPDLLVIDSPRKNLGTTPEDQAHAKRFYAWVAALVGAYEGEFQIIIADNDPPDPTVPVVTRISLSHENPLVRDLPWTEDIEDS